MQCCQYRLTLVFFLICRSLAFSVIWEMNADATVVDVKYHKTVIKSQVCHLFHCCLLAVIIVQTEQYGEMELM